MEINGITKTSLIIILLAISLCVFFPTYIRAHDSLSEQYSKCESKYWFKNLSSFKKSGILKCLKEHHHHLHHRQHHLHHPKVHKQHHLCHHESYNKKDILMKWQNFSNCRCEAALNHPIKDVSVCYQIVQFNKVTGKFLGELSVYKVRDQRTDVRFKFSDKIEILNEDHWIKDDECFYHTKKSPQFVKKYGEMLIEKHYVIGKISKVESMNKVFSDKISPTKYKIIVDNGKSGIVKKDKKVANLPFSGFIFTKIQSIIFQEKGPKEISQKEDDENEKKPIVENEKDKKKPIQDVDENKKIKKKPVQDVDKNEKTVQTPTSKGQPYPTSSTNPTTLDEEDNTINSKLSSSHIKQEEENTKPISGTTLTSIAGIVLFGCVVAVGAAFVGFNTYERRKLRNYRDRNSAQNNSLANVPDYHGYSGGRAY